MNETCHPERSEGLLFRGCIVIPTGGAASCAAPQWRDRGTLSTLFLSRGTSEFVRSLAGLAPAPPFRFRLAAEARFPTKRRSEILQLVLSPVTLFLLAAEYWAH